MTVKELKDIINGIPNRNNDRSVSFCGDLMNDPDGPIDECDIFWGDFSDGILVFINEKAEVKNDWRTLKGFY